MGRMRAVAGVCVVMAAGLVPCVVRGDGAPDPLDRFWRENDGRTVRRLPVGVLPENVFWCFGTLDFADGFKTFDRVMDEGLGRSTYNCMTVSLRCNPELGDAETSAAMKRVAERAHAQGVKVYMDTDPRIARREFLARWPDDRQGLAAVVTAAPANGAAVFSTVFAPKEDHMSWGSKNAYRPLSARVASACAVKRRADGALDFAARRPVEVKTETSLREWRNKGFGTTGGFTDFSELTVKGRGEGLAADETLVVVVVADYLSIDVFSPHLAPFCRELMMRAKTLGADGGFRDEWGFMPEPSPDWSHFFFSSHFAKTHAELFGRDLLADIPLMAFGPTGDAARTAAIGAYMQATLHRMASLEDDFYRAEKEIFGPDVHVAKHPTWSSLPAPGEYFHNGLDWWQATRDWAQGDEITPLYALNALAKKFGGPVWLNEGYTPGADMNVYRVWTYALCGGRQVFHPLYGDDRFGKLPRAEQCLRRTMDLLAPENVTAQSRVRLASLVTRAQVDAPVAFVFGHEELVDWTAPGFDNHGRGHLAKLLAQGWWADAYPASEFARGTFSVDDEGWLRVGRQRYRALALWQLREGEKATFAALTAGRTLKTRIFDGGATAQMAAYLEAEKATRQPRVEDETWAGPLYPRPNGALTLLDGTVVRVAADEKHLAGLPITEELESNGVKASIAANGISAFRAEKGGAVAFAAGGLTRVSAPGLELVLEKPEDVALVKIDGVWHGVWQTTEPRTSIPLPLLRLTSHWIRLLRP